MAALKPQSESERAADFGRATPDFNPDCRRCPRLAAFLDMQRQSLPQYHNAPVAAFGAARPRLLVVGLAPGLHGANRTGRPFTGDHAGILLYRTLHRFGFASAPVSECGDDLRLLDCRITNAVKCVPPQNKPIGAEIRSCRSFLEREFALLKPAVIVALGRVAHETTLSALGLRRAEHPFAHAAEHRILRDGHSGGACPRVFERDGASSRAETPGNRLLIDSYHCSRYNTQTGRLTEAMFDEVFQRARDWLDAQSPTAPDAAERPS